MHQKNELNKYILHIHFHFRPVRFLVHKNPTRAYCAPETLDCKQGKLLLDASPKYENCQTHNRPEIPKLVTCPFIKGPPQTDLNTNDSIMSDLHEKPTSAWVNNRSAGKFLKLFRLSEYSLR